MMVWFSVGDFHRNNLNETNLIDGKSAVARPLKEPPYKSFFFS
jgi:hypothetical protein